MWVSFLFTLLCFISNINSVLGQLYCVLGRPTLVGKASSFTDELYLFISFYQSTVLSSHAVDGHQMYFGGSVAGKASTIGREISPTPPVMSQGSKCAKFGDV